MEKIPRVEGRMVLLNCMQTFAQPDSDGGRRFAVSFQQLMDAMREKYPNITVQSVHMLCRLLVKDKQIWCPDRGDEALDKSVRILTFGIVEPGDPDVLELSAVERAAVVISRLSEKIEGEAGLKNITKGTAIEIRNTIMDLMCEIHK